MGLQRAALPISVLLHGGLIAAALWAMRLVAPVNDLSLEGISVTLVTEASLSDSPADAQSDATLTARAAGALAAPMEVIDTKPVEDSAVQPTEVASLEAPVETPTLNAQPLQDIAAKAVTDPAARPVDEPTEVASLDAPTATPLAPPSMASAAPETEAVPTTPPAAATPDAMAANAEPIASATAASIDSERPAPAADHELAVATPADTSIAPLEVASARAPNDTPVAAVADAAAAPTPEISEADPITTAAAQPQQEAATRATAIQPSQVAQLTDAATPMTPTEQKPVELKEAEPPKPAPKPPADPPKKPVKDTKPPKPPKPAKVAAGDGGASDAGAEAAATRKGGAGKSGQGSAAVSRYPGVVLAKLKRVLRRPASGGFGTVHVGFTVRSDGSVSGIRVVTSSGSDALDAAAKATVTRAAPFPPIPADASRSSWDFVMPLTFRR